MALLLLAAPALAQQSEHQPAQGTDLTTLNIEDLMNIQVTSVSKTEQKLSRAAAAVFVITQEDIRRSGAANIPDLLRMVPGLDVAEINGSTWAISSRGFNGQLSNKLLVMIDSRIVYTPNFAGVYWDTLDLPLEDIDRIEVIRGPGGSIWGANAVNGVISIFTKKAAATAGAMFETGGGNVDQSFGTVQYGGKLGKGTDYRVYAKYINQGQQADLTGQNGDDGWHMLRGGVRTDTTLSSKDSLTVEGDLYTARIGELGLVLPSLASAGFVAPPEEINLGGGFIQSTWSHVYSDRSDSTLQASLTRYRRADPLEPETRDTLDLDYHHHIAWGGRQDLVWGLSYRYTTDYIGGSLTVSYNPAHRALNLFSSFVQDEIALVPDKLYLTVGTKLEHNDYTGLEVMPSAGVTWAPGSHHMIWAAVSKALRAPSRNDSNLELNFGTGGTPDLQRLFGNPKFRDERLIGYEAGYRTTLESRLSLDAAIYVTDYDNVQTTEPLSPFLELNPPPAHEVQPYTYENLLYGETHGIEVAANWKLLDSWTLSPGYAFEQIHMHTRPTSADTQTGPFIEGNSPRHSAQLRSHWELGHGLAWDASAYFVDRLTNQGPFIDVTIPAYTRLDTSLTWNPRKVISISVIGQNLLRDHHPEFMDVNGIMQSGQIKRSGYAKVTWKF